MNKNPLFDVIIVGGSYAGLAAGMALGRALRRVLIVDAGEPCNRQTPHSHNFITHDGRPPLEIAAQARKQVTRYTSVRFMHGRVTDVRRRGDGFDVRAGDTTVGAKRLLFASGVRDVMPDIPGYSACWGISALHCPYCHGYEVRDQVTGVLGNGDRGFDQVRMIAHWTRHLTLFTNGPSTLTPAQTGKLGEHHIRVVETAIGELVHTHGRLEHIRFTDGTTSALTVLYAQPDFEQGSPLPQALGCGSTEDGHIQVDGLQRTTAPGIYAAGDNNTRLRTVANAVAQGTTAGMMLNKELITLEF